MSKITETSVQTFSNSQFGELRIQNLQGNIWFCLNDVANALDLANPRDLIKRLSAKGVDSIYTPTKGGNQSMTYIDEPNLYRCIFQSRKEEAEKFQDWVFEEVLPSIRQTGGYIATAQEDTPELIMAKALQVAQSTIERHKQQLQIIESERDHYIEEVKALAPKARYTDEVLQSTSTFTATQMAKDFGMSAIAFNKKLKELGVQFKQSGQWMLTCKYQDKGYTDMRVANYKDLNTNEMKTSQSLVWTERGRQFLHQLFTSNN